MFLFKENRGIIMKGDEVEKELISRLLETDNTPDDDLTIDKIVERACEFSKRGSEISFLIERHPGYGRRASWGKGIGMSAFWRELTKYTFNLDSEQWKIEVIKSKFEYDPWLMAYEEIDQLEDGGFLPTQVKDEGELERIINEATEIIEKYLIETNDGTVSDEEFNEMLNRVIGEMRKILKEKYTSQ